MASLKGPAKLDHQTAHERAVRPMLIVVPSPRVDFVLRAFNRFEPVGVQAFLAEATVEALDDRAVGRSTATTEVDLHWFV